jgi:LL-diaminopimelate aminotransferase
LISSLAQLTYPLNSQWSFSSSHQLLEISLAHWAFILPVSATGGGRTTPLNQYQERIMQVNNHLAGMPAGYLFSEIAKRVSLYEQQHPDRRLIRMGIGDVTRPLAPSVAGAFAKAAAGMAEPAGFFGYGPERGYPFILEAIIKHEYESRGVKLQPDEVFLSDGAKTDTSGLQELFSADSRIAVTDPVYPVYVDANAMAGRLGDFIDGKWSKLITLPCTHENGFVPELPRERADVLYLCYPNNPTGTVLNKAQLKIFVDWARENETLIIYDAAYKAFISDPDIPRSIYEVEGARDVAVECCSFSKTAGFTGVRCAFTVIPKGVMGKMEDGSLVSLNALWKRRSGSKFNGVSYPVQKAAEAVYQPRGQEELSAIISYYRNNAGLLLSALRDTGANAVGGVHAPYIWLKCPNGMRGWDFFDYLMDTAGVVGTPGEGFGMSGAGCFRLTAFGSFEDTMEAAARVRHALNTL